MLLCRRGGITDFDALHFRRNDESAFAYAFDHIEADGDHEAAPDATNTI